MKLIATFAPPHSVVLFMNFESGKPPESFAEKLVSATSTCVAVGTLSEQDGQTNVTLTDELPQQLESSIILAFDGLISVSGKYLSLVTTLNEPIMSLPVRQNSLRIRVWVNDNVEPDRILVVAG